MSSLKEKWSEVLKILKEEMPANNYDNWVPPLVPSSFENNKIILLSPHSFSSFTLKMPHNEEIITKALSKVFGEAVAFDVVYDQNLEEIYNKQQKKAEKEEKKQTVSKFAESKYDGLKQMQSDCNLNTKYQFDNFIVGSYNKFAYGAAFAIATGEKRYNPLFIYGSSGLGKTHLMQAIGNYILLNKKLKVRYVMAEVFLNELINNLSKGYDKPSAARTSEVNKQMKIFREKYRNIDVLLIDDIQQVAGKDRTQIELFNIFNSMHQEGKQIVFTSDRPPSEIPKLAENLKTRFEGGLLADIGMPDLETRMAILKQLESNEKNIKLSMEIIEFLAQIYKNNIRELEGAFNKVCAYCSIYKQEPTISNVKEAINYNAVVKTINGMNIVNEAAKFYGLTADDICGPSRVGKIAYARKITVYLIRELTGESWQSIGNLLGKRKYTTMMHAYEEAEKEREVKKQVSGEINTLFNIINQI